MKKKIIGLACFALFIFFYATLRNLGSPAKLDDCNTQSSNFHNTSTLDFVKGNASLIEPCGPGSGRGRGPTTRSELADPTCIT